jgi:hypothetical protein
LQWCKPDSGSWKVDILDPNYPSQVRTLIVDPNGNTFCYSGISDYSGGEWSGGRFFYMPFDLVCTIEESPVSDLISLIIKGTEIFFSGANAQSTLITDADGNDVSAHGQRAIDLAKQGKSLDGFFTQPLLSCIESITLGFKNLVFCT